MAENKEKMKQLLDTEGQVYVIDENFTRVYANNIQYSMSLWDANLTFGEIIGEQDGKTIVLQKVKVNVSKELAKVLMFILEKNIGFYEEKAGEIALPTLEIAEPQAKLEAPPKKLVRKRAKG